MKNNLISILIKNKIITENEYKEIIKLSQDTQVDIKDTLLNKGIIDEDLFYDILKKELDIKSIVLDDINISKSVIDLISKELCKKHTLIPFYKNDDELFLAMNDPTKSNVIKDIEFITKMKVIPYFERKNRIFCAIERYYEKSKIKKEKDSVDNAPIVKLVNSIFNEAIKLNGSDIHIEPFKKGVKIRYRIDGILTQRMFIPRDVYMLVGSRIKIKAGMDISKKMIPLDGKIKYTLKDREFDLRVSTIPTIYGEKFVIRILYKSNKIISLDNLIRDNYEKNKIKNILKKQSGIILITGPTGAGKTTTLFSMISELNVNDKNIVTIEDPVEYEIDGVNHMNVNNKTGLTFLRGLKSILRQDPDVIIVGEIRDVETADIAVKAAITGHLVLATLHTKDATSAILRLKDMMIKDYLIADSVVGVISQRLIRKLCVKCSGGGCDECNESGFKGRCGVFEIMDLNENHKKIIRDKKSIKELRDYSIKNGMITLEEYCKRLVLNNITTKEEMMRAFYGWI